MFMMTPGDRQWKTGGRAWKTGKAGRVRQTRWKPAGDLLRTFAEYEKD
jgi:hypothetical protein